MEQGTPGNKDAYSEKDQRPLYTIPPADPIPRSEALAGQGPKKPYAKTSTFVPAPSWLKVFEAGATEVLDVNAAFLVISSKSPWYDRSMMRGSTIIRGLMRGAILSIALAVTVLLSCSFDPGPPPPRYDHVVVVIEENHSAAQVMGSPYLSSLAARGTSFSAMYGITHPSQPNYFALFSGSTQGVTDDGPYALSAPNLAGSLITAGLSFATYSEGLPAAGDTVFTSGRYVRKHNPCASFTNLPGATVNLPFSSYPSADYTLLPTVSFVIPDLDNDLHDGTVAAGDAWLHANLDGFVRWAGGHNSLLIVTFDECNGSDPVSTTPIATIFAGASLRQSVSFQRLTLYSLLRMVEDIYGLPYLGQEASAPRITGVWN